MVYVVVFVVGEVFEDRIAREAWTIYYEEQSLNEMVPGGDLLCSQAVHTSSWRCFHLDCSPRPRNSASSAGMADLELAPRMGTMR